MHESYSFDEYTASTFKGKELILADLRSLLGIAFELEFDSSFNSSHAFYMRASFSDFTNIQKKECWRNISASVEADLAWRVQIYILGCYLINRYYHESCSEKTSKSPQRLYESRTLFFDLFKLMYSNKTKLWIYRPHVYKIMYFCLYMSYQHYYSDSDIESPLWNLYIDGLFYYLNHNSDELSEVIGIYEGYLENLRVKNDIQNTYDDLLIELLFYYEQSISADTDNHSLPILDSYDDNYRHNLVRCLSN